MAQLSEQQNLMQQDKLSSYSITTPIGDMLAVANSSNLLLLEFSDSVNINNKLNNLQARLQQEVTHKENHVIASIKNELKQYFSGNLLEFVTPTYNFGTEFQQQVWEQLKQIPFAQTTSYASLAKAINKPKAFRAVANANGANCLAIITPCHRVIQTNNSLGGYAGGIKRKKWLLEHEKNCIALK